MKLAWPGFLGPVTPRTRCIEEDGAGDQIRGPATSVVPDFTTLKDWARGTMGVAGFGIPGGQRYMGGFFVSRSIVVKWALSRRSFVYKAGDEGRHHFAAAAGVKFDAGAYQKLCARQAKACVLVALEHSMSAEATCSWLDHVVMKECDCMDDRFNDLLLAHNIPMFQTMTNHIRKVLQNRLLNHVDADIFGVELQPVNDVLNRQTRRRAMRRPAASTRRVRQRR